MMTEMHLSNESNTEVVIAPVIMDKREFLLTVPEYEESVKTKKRYAQEPDISVLKPQQKELFDTLWDFVNGDGKMFLVRGYAGTGKSFTINTFIESWLARKKVSSGIISAPDTIALKLALGDKATVNPLNRVVLTAPTNKAVKVLKNGAQYYHTNLEFMTVHKLLGLKVEIDQHGKEVFKKDFNEPCKLENFRLLVVDETSMLSDELFELLLPFLDDGLKIIFMGDPCQIPPVGLPDSIPLREQFWDKLGIKHFDLTEIIRQGAGSPIIDTTFKIREGIRAEYNRLQRQTVINDKGAVVFIDNADSQTLEEMLQKYYTSDNFKNDSDFIKILAWRNKVVDFFNSKVRGFIYGPMAGKLEIGEKLIADQPIFEGEEMLFTSNDEMEVISYTIAEQNINEGQYILKYYVATVRSLDRPEKADVEIKIIHETSEKAFKDILKALIAYAKMQAKGTINAKRGWEEYYGFLKRFASVKYAYAITCHRSQGSTYNTAIVYEGDIENNSNAHERNRIKYTACSRASRLLVVI